MKPEDAKVGLTCWWAATSVAAVKECEIQDSRHAFPGILVRVKETHATFKVHPAEIHVEPQSAARDVRDYLEKEIEELQTLLTDLNTKWPEG